MKFGYSLRQIQVLSAIAACVLTVLETLYAGAVIVY